MTISNDSKTENKTTEVTPTLPKTRPSKTTVSNTMIFFGCLIIGAFIAILLIDLKLVNETRLLSTALATLKHQQIQDKTQQNLTETTLSTSTKRTSAQLNALEKTLATALQERFYQANDWLLLKARYYLELASINRNWSDTTQTTRALLKEADRLLAPIQTPQIFTIRQAIAKERATLLMAPNIDKVGILSQLDAIQQLVDELPARSLQSTFNKGDTTPTHGQKSWRDTFKASLLQLDKLIIIRHVDSTINPLLTPTYEALLRAAIHLNLQETAWAVLEGKQTIYQMTLTQAIGNITRTFDIQSPKTKAILLQINALQKTTITPQKTAPLESLPLINQLIEVKTTAITPTSMGEPS